MNGLSKRLIACFDVVGSKVTKAEKFQNNIHIGDAASMAKNLYAQGIDEIIFYDIKASAEKRKLDVAVVESVGKEVFVPFTVGGGIRSVADMYSVLKAGSEKISIDSMAVRNPELIRAGAKAFGRQCIVLSIQVIKRGKSPKLASGYEIAIDGARIFTGKDAVDWAKQGADLGAGEIVVNSIDRDGTCSGYDLEIIEAIAKAVNVPVIASGGAGSLEHVSLLFTKTEASAAIISSMLYSTRLSRNFSVHEIKEYLVGKNIPMRACHEAGSSS